MLPVKTVSNHWKAVEPYEFRLPVPEVVVEALIGKCYLDGDLFCTFLAVSFYHWLHPAEVLAMQWCGVVPIWTEPLSFGLCRIGNPKIKSPVVQHVVQHVLTESPGARQLLHAIWQAHGAQKSGRIYPWSPGFLAQSFLAAWRSGLGHLEL